jgi:acylphosphatase
MKKLLALILCVMMFVSVISTSAFAAYDTTDQRTWAGESQNKKIVEALRTNIENMYGSYAVDNAVYNSVKTIDGILKDLVDGALKDYTTSAFNGAAGLTSSSDLNDAIVAGLRSTIGGQISEYLNKHYNDYYTYDSMGNRVFNPTKYAGVYAKAATNALTSDKATAGIQAYMLYAYQRSAFNTVANMAHDLAVDIDGWDHWEDYGFSDMDRGIHSWLVPNQGNFVDGILHNIDPNYASMLSALGQLGVNLDGSTMKFTDKDGKVHYEDTYGLGFEGWVKNVDDGYSVSVSSDDETPVTPLIESINIRWPNADGVYAVTSEVYEGNTETIYRDYNYDGDYTDPATLFTPAEGITHNQFVTEW